MTAPRWENEREPPEGTRISSLSEDAKNLTRALRGSAKAQGTWGEWILETVLETSGLRKGEEYVVQSNQPAKMGAERSPM